MAALLSLVLFISPFLFGQLRPGSVSNPNIQTGRRPSFYDKKMTEAQKQLLTPLPEDKAAFAEFLRQDNTGIIRLLPKGKYEFSRTVAVNRDPDTILPLLGGGAFYSFSEKTQKFGPWSEIALDNGVFVTGFISRGFGILTNIGDVPLDSVTPTSPGVEFLSDFNPPALFADSLAQKKKNSEGFKTGNFAYRNAQPARLNSTYVLRSVVYKREFFINPLSGLIYIRPDTLAWLQFEGSNILVAFRVVRQYEDGSMVLVWKRLKKYSIPKLKGEPNKLKISEVKKLIDTELPTGSTVEQVIRFLDSQGISHSDYFEREVREEESPEPVTQRLVYATIPSIERNRFSTYDLHILFLFDEEEKMLEYKLEKVRK